MDDDMPDAAASHPRRRYRDRSESDEARVEAIRVDLSRLKEHGDFKPVVEYLTAIQTMRGDGSSLMFVRGDDLDRMAERNGNPVPEFLERLDQLGVVVSSN